MSNSGIRPARWDILFAVAAVSLWLLSLAMPSIGPRGGTALSGFEVLSRGWSAWRYGVVAWFANPVLLLAVIALVWKKPRLAAASGFVGCILAVSSYWAGTFAALAGRSVPELFFASGFYLWMAAHLAVLCGGIRLMIRRADS